MSQRFEQVARASELADGDIVAVEAGGRALCLYRVGDEFFATQRACIHQGADLAEGIVSSGMVVCGLHGWRFDLRTGQHERSPETCLITHAVRIEGDRVLVSTTPNPLPFHGDLLP